MSRSCKVYNSWQKDANGNSTALHQTRGGNKGVAVDTSFGAPGNRNRTKKNYRKVKGTV